MWLEVESRLLHSSHRPHQKMEQLILAHSKGDRPPTHHSLHAGSNPTQQPSYVSYAEELSKLLQPVELVCPAYKVRPSG
jgi:hypothetical protein